MTTAFDKVCDFSQRLGLALLTEDREQQLLVAEAPEQGIHHLVLDCEDDILVIEQLIAEFKVIAADDLVCLLQANRNLVHGALCLDEAGKRLLFRDTLALENLDFNELQSSVNALSLMLAEYAGLFIDMAKKGA